MVHPGWCSWTINFNTCIDLPWCKLSLLRWMPLLSIHWTITTDHLWQHIVSLHVIHPVDCIQSFIDWVIRSSPRMGLLLRLLSNDLLILLLFEHRLLQRCWAVFHSLIDRWLSMSFIICFVLFSCFLFRDAILLLSIVILWFAGTCLGNFGLRQKLSSW